MTYRKMEPACLLIHGFTSSPKEMENLGEFLQGNGYEVRIPLLPGHNSKPEALMEVRHRDWIETIEQAYHETAVISDHLFVIGQSLGAALALHLAANFRIAGVVVLATALRLPLWRTAAVFTLSPLIRWRSKPNGPDVMDKSAFHRLNSYNTYPTASVKELIRTMRTVRRELHKVEAPLLVMHGRHDRTMSFKNVEMLRRKVRSREIEIKILENSSHVLTVDYDHEEICAAILSFIRRHD